MITRSHLLRLAAITARRIFCASLVLRCRIAAVTIDAPEPALLVDVGRERSDRGREPGLRQGSVAAHAAVGWRLRRAARGAEERTGEEQPPHAHRTPR